MTFRTILRTISATMLGLCASLAHAAPAPSFTQLLRIALEGAPLARAYEADIRAAAGDARQAHAWLNPTIDGVAENLAVRQTPDGVTQRQTTYTVTQPFEIGGKRGARIAAGESNLRAARARSRQGRVAFAVQLAFAYATAEAMQGRVKLADEDLVRVNEDLSAARALVQAGKEAQLRIAQANASVPGLANFWIPPIRNRIDMLSTGIKSPIGIKVAGSNLAEIDNVARQIETVAKTVPGVSSALAERLTGGRYIDVVIDRAAASRYGMNIADVQSIISGAIGGETVGQTVEGLSRYPISVRYPRELRDSLDDLRNLPVVTPSLQQITLGTIADMRVSEGPPMLRSENGRPVTWIYIDGRGRALTAIVGDLQRAIAAKVKLTPGVSITYTGQFESFNRGPVKDDFERHRPIYDWVTVGVHSDRGCQRLQLHWRR